MKMIAFLVTLSAFLITTHATYAGGFMVPHQPGDKINLIVQTTQYAHPTDYWWHMDPSSKGSWDYFTPVKYLYQPVPLEPQANNQQAVAATIPVTQRPAQ